ncbi:MAG TPA: ABC transporter permease [Solirubrobacteraceae bacterium]|jgi:ABC-2 type transport system permease protein
MSASPLGRFATGGATAGTVERERFASTMNTRALTRAAAAGHAFIGVVRRDLGIYLSYRVRLVSQLMTALFSLTLFYYVSRLVHVSGFRSPASYFGFVVVGISMVSVMYSCFSIPELVRQELIAGTFDRLLLSPFGAVRGVLAMSLFPLLYAFVLAALTLALGCLLFGLELHWATVPWSLPVMALALCAFVPFGLLLAALTVVIKQGNVGTSWLIALLSIIGGLYFPVTLLPNWLQSAAHLQPFTAATNLLRHLLLDSPLGESTAVALGKLALFAVVLVPLSIYVLATAIRFGQRRGTIIEY